jgi:hypothetical protein
MTILKIPSNDKLNEWRLRLTKAGYETMATVLSPVFVMSKNSSKSEIVE